MFGRVVLMVVCGLHLMAIFPTEVLSGYCGWPVGPGPCNWNKWGSWSSCSRTCGGGSQTRSRSACCWPRHNHDECVRHCDKITESGFRESRTCNCKCYNGGSCVGSNCKCTPSYRGYCCQTRITCSRLPTVSNGVISYSSFYYGGRATLRCNRGYRLTRGSSVRTCTGSYGSWSGRSQVCSDINECASNPCQNGGTCVNGNNRYNCRCTPGHYGRRCESTVKCSIPRVTNGKVIGGKTQVTYGQIVEYECDEGYALTSGNLMRKCEGSTIGYLSGRPPRCVYAENCRSNPCQNGGSCEDEAGRYTCRCPKERSGTHCETDIAPPTVEKCPQDQTYFTEERKLNVTWDEPVFSDGFNSSIDLVDVSGSYPDHSSMLDWGRHVISYTATKRNNGKRATCKFTISVFPHPCDDLRPPANGAVVCNGWNKELARACKVYCQQKWTLPITESLENLYVCHSTGQWVPADGLTNHTMDCSVERSTHGDPASQENYYDDDCMDSRTEYWLADQFRSHLKGSRYRQLCDGYPFQSYDCRNVDIFCGSTNSTTNP